MKLRTGVQARLGALAGLLIIASACQSRTLSSPPLGEDAPYPGEDEDIAESVKIIDGMQAHTAETERSKSFFRGAHAKGIGCVDGLLTPIKDRAEETKVGAFANFKSYQVFGRFSNASPGIEDDAKTEPRGFAFHIRDVPGKKLFVRDGNSHDMDLSMVNLPAFPAASVADYNTFLTSRAWYAFTHLFTVLRIRGMVPKDVKTVLDQRYFSSGAIKWGEKAAKLALKPCALPVKSFLTDVLREQDEKNFLASELRSHLETQAACFELGVQLQRDPVKQPVEDLTVVWDEAETPFLPIARLEIPKQKVDNPRTIGSKCETASFNPWRTIADHRPLGALNRARLKVYEASALARKK
jgi:hypothetical protein